MKERFQGETGTRDDDEVDSIDATAVVILVVGDCFVLLRQTAVTGLKLLELLMFL